MVRTFEGKALHEKMMRLAGDYLKKKGYEVVNRSRVNSGIVDVLGIKQGERVGIECQVVPSWKIFVHKTQIYSKYLSKLILAIPKNVAPRLMPEGVELLKLDVERPKPHGKIVVVLDDDVEDWVRSQNRKKGDISKLINQVLQKEMDEHEKGEKK
jgi:hypothetical protein